MEAVQAPVRSWLLYLGMIVLTLAATAGRLGAQASAGGIRGVVRDGSGAVLPGVTVEATSPGRIGGAATAVTNTQGLYIFENLRIGVYSVTFTLTGFTKVQQDLVRVEVGRAVQNDVTMSLGTIEETVTVSGASPVVDAVHAGTSTTLTSQLLESIPTQRSSWFDVVDTAPSVIQENPTTALAPAAYTRVRLYWASSDQVQVQYDGVSVQVPTSNAAWDYPNYDIIEEVQVKSVGADAASAGSLGGIVNLITKSGGSKWRGSAGYYGVQSGLVGNNLPQAPIPFHVDYRSDATGSIGGPLLKDHLWVIGLVNDLRISSTNPGVPPELARAQHLKKGFFKATTRFGSNNVSAGASGYQYRYPGVVTLLLTDDGAGMNLGWALDPIFRWTRTMGKATLLEVRGGGLLATGGAHGLVRSTTTSGRLDLTTGVADVYPLGANNLNLYGRDELAVTIGRTVDLPLRGTHEFQFGGQYSSGEVEQNGSLPQNRYFYDRNGQPYYVVERQPSLVNATTHVSAVFAQDTWTAADRLTLTLGVRFDHTVGGVPPAERLELTSPTCDSPQGCLSGWTTADHSSGLPGNLFTFNTVSPRLGATVKLDTTGKTVLKGFYGRYYGQMALNMFSAVSPGNTVSNYFFYNPATKAYDIPYFSVNPRANFGVDPQLKNQYGDQFFVGLERELLPDLGLTVSYMKRRERDLLRMRDTTGTYAPRTFTDTFQGFTQNLTAYNLVSPSSQSMYQVTNRPDMAGTYETAVIEANKRFSKKWQLLASYAWQGGRGYANPLVGPGRQDFSNLSPGSWSSDPNDLVNDEGPVGGLSPHSIKLGGSYQAPYGIQLGGKFDYESGIPYGRLITVLGLGQGAKDVLATSRDTYSLPASKIVAVRVDKTFTLGANRRLAISMNLFNLFNEQTPVFINNNSSQTRVPFGGLVTVTLPRYALLGARFEF